MTGVAVSAEVDADAAAHPISADTVRQRGRSNGSALPGRRLRRVRSDGHDSFRNADRTAPNAILADHAGTGTADHDSRPLRDRSPWFPPHLEE